MPYGRPQVAESLAGVQWNFALASVLNEQWQALKFFSDITKWIAVASFDGVDSPMMQSVDGKTWAAIPGVPLNVARDLDHSPELGQTIVGSQDNVIQLVTSTDGGATWVTSTPVPGVASGYIAIRWCDSLSGGLWVAAGPNNVPDGAFITSPDGVIWTVRPKPGGTTVFPMPRAMAFAGQIPRVVVASDPAASTHQIFFSNDGITWNALNPLVAGDALTKIIWAPELNGGAGFFVATALSGGAATTRSYTSPDGINWTARIMPQSAVWRSLAWNAAAKRLVAVNNNATLANGGARFASSVDGINWRNEWGPTLDYIDIAASSEQDIFAAIANPTGAIQSVAFSE